MAGKKDFYSLLGVSRYAKRSEIRRAYRRAARRLHPDKNVSPGDTELFLELTEAYQTLNDPVKRSEHDTWIAGQEGGHAEEPRLKVEVWHSHQSLQLLSEPQVHYLLLDFSPLEGTFATRSPINLCMVVDRSTSMQGPRLDQVRAGALSVLERIQPHDMISMVAFSDRADLVLSPDQAHHLRAARARLSLLQASGGTEIASGLELGLAQLRGSLVGEGINHLVLFTDGHTYGDEETCLGMATQAAGHGIVIHAVGIGSDWNDPFLDGLATRTGGHVAYMDSSDALAALSERLFGALQNVVARRVRLDGKLDPRAGLRTAFRLLPEPMPLGADFPLQLGNLPHGARLSVLLELLLQPLGEEGEVSVADLSFLADFLTPVPVPVVIPIPIRAPVARQADIEPPPPRIISAARLIALHSMQERARNEAELEHFEKASRRLEQVAERLLAQGQPGLANTALMEARRLSRTSQLSSSAEKALKYGTRALLTAGQEGSS